MHLARARGSGQGFADLYELTLRLGAMIFARYSVRNRELLEDVAHDVLAELCARNLMHELLDGGCLFPCRGGYLWRCLVRALARRLSKDNRYVGWDDLDLEIEDTPVAETLELVERVLQVARQVDPRALIVLGALKDGALVGDACRMAGVSRMTWWRWKHEIRRRLES